MSEQREGQTQYIVLFPDALFDHMDQTAKRNRRDFTDELCVAVERYIAARATDPPPEYEGTLKRRKLWLPGEIHRAVSKLAKDRGTSMNKVFMAAAHWHVQREEVERP